MKLTTGFKYNLPFELWTGAINPQTNSLVFTKDSDRLGTIVQGAGGINLVTADSLPLQAQVRNLLDSEGKPIFMLNGQPYVMYVNTSEPQFDPFMRIIGWRHRVTREMTKDSVQALLDAGITFNG